MPPGLIVSAATILARSGDPEAADAALAAAITAGDRDVGLRVARARLAEERERTDLALGHWRRVLDVAGDHLEGRLGTIRTLRAEGRFAESERFCRSLLAAVPKDPRPVTELARIAHDGGDPVEAERRWHAALIAHPGQPSLLLGLAKALTAQHRFAEARAILETLADRDPTRAEPLAELVRTLLSEGDLLAAEQRARALGQRASGSGLHVLLARVHEAAGDLAGAARVLAAIAAAAPEDPAPRLALAELATRQGDLATARDGFETALAMAPGRSDALVGLADVLAELELVDAAEVAAAEAVRRAPNQPRAHAAGARVAEATGRLDAARLALLEARSAMPWRVEPLLQLAELALRHGQREAIATHGAALIAAHPRNLRARLAAFDCAMATDQIEPARAILASLAEELPAHRDVERRLARLEWHDGSIDRARARWRRITRFDPRIHGAPDPIERLDRHALPPPRGEIRVFMLVRNELSRLPWLLQYYRGLGVTRFLVLDNASDDGTTDWLLAQGRDVHLFRTEASFALSGAGMRWINRLLDEHGNGAWCLTVDADEVLVYPEVETTPLQALTTYLDAIGAEAMAAPMVDLYAAEQLDQVRYTQGRSLIESFPWFDAEGYVRRDSNDFPYFRLHGGARARVFHAHPGTGPVLQKVPLIHWREDIKYTSSKHTAFPCRLADVTGALLHFKYLPDFAGQVRAEVARGQHYLGAKEYRAYQRRLDQGEALTLIGPPSRRYQGSRQLLQLGLISSSRQFEAHLAHRH